MCSVTGDVGVECSLGHVLPGCTEVILPAALMKIVVGSPSMTGSDRRLVVVVW